MSSAWNNKRKRQVLGLLDEGKVTVAKAVRPLNIKSEQDHEFPFQKAGRQGAWTATKPTVWLDLTSAGQAGRR